MATVKGSHTKDCSGLDPERVKHIVAELISQRDIVAAEVCGEACLRFCFKGGQYQIDNLPPEIVGKIPAVVSKVREMSQVL